eukprot:Clim_evm207s157 gene=Clim_evmTU207s157
MGANPAKGIFDLKGNLAFYGAYHNNGINQLIHIIFVPQILWSALVWLSYSGPLIDIKQFWPGAPDYIELNAAFLLISVYISYYLILTPIAALPYSFFLAYLWISAGQFRDALGDDAVTLSLIVHATGWAMQFIGHGVAEGRKPALMDNLFQSVFLAPLFVYLEVLFHFGYNPQLQKEIQVLVAADIAAFKAESKKKSK